MARKFELTLVEVMVVKPLAQRLERGAGLDEVGKALKVLDALEFTETEQGVIDEHTSPSFIICRCGTRHDIPGGGSADLTTLPPIKKKIVLEDSPYEWFLPRVTGFQGWVVVRKEIETAADAIRAAEKFEVEAPAEGEEEPASE